MSRLGLVNARVGLKILTEDAGFGEKRCEGCQEATEATTDIGKLWGPRGGGKMHRPVYGIGGVWVLQCVVGKGVGML
jgi:hypothetical protein